MQLGWKMVVICRGLVLSKKDRDDGTILCDYVNFIDRSLICYLNSCGVIIRSLLNKDIQQQIHDFKLNLDQVVDCQSRSTETFIRVTSTDSQLGERRNYEPERSEIKEIDSINKVTPVKSGIAKLLSENKKG